MNDADVLARAIEALEERRARLDEAIALLKGFAWDGPDSREGPRRRRAKKEVESARDSEERADSYRGVALSALKAVRAAGREGIAGSKITMSILGRGAYVGKLKAAIQDAFRAVERPDLMDFVIVERSVRGGYRWFPGERIREGIAVLNGGGENAAE